MKKSSRVFVYNDEEIIDKIRIIRGMKVMLDKDLAEMYEVPTSRLNEAVKRNKGRFPEDFMFRLTEEEAEFFSRSQIAILKKRRGSNVKYLPYAFTEQGVAMLSSVLRSERAIQVNIRIIRIYIKMKQVLIDNKALWQKIEKIEQALAKKDIQVNVIFDTLKKLVAGGSRPSIGFKISEPK